MADKTNRQARLAHLGNSLQDAAAREDWDRLGEQARALFPALRTLAAQGGLSIETRPTTADLAPLRLAVTSGGIALALAVLAMTVGLIRSETAPDLSTLAATGASSRVRRTITAATAGSLGLIGGLTGTAGAYLTLVVWHRHDLSVLNPAPLTALLALVVGLPVIAWAVGWLLGGREPHVLARRRLE